MARHRLLVSVSVCPLCGGFRTLARAWIRANSGDPDPKGIFTENGFCLDCNEEVELGEKFVSNRKYLEIEKSY